MAHPGQVSPITTTAAYLSSSRQSVSVCINGCLSLSFYGRVCVSAPHGSLEDFLVAFVPREMGGYLGLYTYLSAPTTCDLFMCLSLDWSVRLSLSLETYTSSSSVTGCVATGCAFKRLSLCVWVHTCNA